MMGVKETDAVVESSQQLELDKGLDWHLAFRIRRAAVEGGREQIAGGLCLSLDWVGFGALW
jgi:hypothetical protein